MTNLVVIHYQPTMNREIEPRKIEFRAWDNIAKMMIYPNEYEHEFITFDGKAVQIFGNPQERTDVEELDYTLMQFTGLYDCNNQKIFEGGILKYDGDYEGDRWEEEGVAEVRYVDNSFNLWFGDEFIGDLWHFVHNRNAVVIGNIFQNPDLLTNLDQNKDGAEEK